MLVLNEIIMVTHQIVWKYTQVDFEVEWFFVCLIHFLEHDLYVIYVYCDPKKIGIWSFLWQHGCRKCRLAVFDRIRKNLQSKCIYRINIMFRFQNFIIAISRTVKITLHNISSRDVFEKIWMIVTHWRGVWSISSWEE